MLATVLAVSLFLQPHAAPEAGPRLLDAALASPVAGSGGEDAPASYGYTWRVFGTIGGAYAGGLVATLVASFLPTANPGNERLFQLVQLVGAAGGAYGGYALGYNADAGDGSSQAAIASGCVLEGVGTVLILGALILALQSFT